MKMLKDRVVLVTGASRGIGAATARLLARHGAAVAVNYMHSALEAERVVQEIVAEGGRAIPVRADVLVQEEVEFMVQQITAQLGSVDTLVLNAHIPAVLGPIVRLNWADFEGKLVGEMKAAFHCVRAVVPAMLAQKQGCIIAISSSTSSYPMPGSAGQSTAKAALNALMKLLAIELAPGGIRVNVVAPGLTLTDTSARLPEHIKVAMADMTPLGRNGQPEDVAGAVFLLALDEAGFLTGNTLGVDGGIHLGLAGLTRKPA